MAGVFRRAVLQGWSVSKKRGSPKDEKRAEAIAWRNAAQDAGFVELSMADQDSGELLVKIVGVDRLIPWQEAAQIHPVTASTS